MADPRVVIVTGSRTRRWQRQLYGVLDQIAAAVGRNQIVIRHGNNPAGADWWAHMWCMDRGLRPEQEDAMPADWGQYGRAAGMIRNRSMCRKGAYLCVAFLDWCRAPGCNAVPTAATA
jgi:hypothetical protein